MGCLTKLGIICLVLAIAFAYFWHKLDEVPDIPDIPDTYWGQGQQKTDDPAIKPFQIKISDTELNDFWRRLNNTRTPIQPLEGIGFQYGFNTDYLNTVISFWRTKYNWRERETYLNQFPQFQTQVSGLNIHFLHVKPAKEKIPKGCKVIPLLLLHGWPGSVREFYDLIPLLITPRSEENFVFEVVAPSLPGYGFSEGASRPGLGYAQVAVVMKKLMNKLGYEKFYIQGGDWGAAIGMSMAVLYPKSVEAYHSNMCMARSHKAHILMVLGSFFPSLVAEAGHEARISHQFSFLLEESGYMHLQGTKPDTVGVGLTDSPAGLAAYILEKFSTWTNHSWRHKMDGGLNHYKLTDLLDNVMVYWFSRSITTSMRLYSESFARAHMDLKIERIPVNVPMGCARFPGELVYIPRFLIENAYPKLVRLTDMPKGGHFAAFEVPDLLAEDLWQFTSLVRSKEKVKKNTPSTQTK